jgi:O-antigen ligase
VINNLLFSLLFSNFIILSFGIYDFFFPTFWQKFHYVQTNHFKLLLNEKEKILIRNTNNYPIEVQINNEKFLIPSNFLLSFKLEKGSYEIASKDYFFIYQKDRISNEFIYFRNFWNERNNFIGPFGHKLVASGFFSITTILFFCASLYFRRIFLIGFIISFLSLILTFSKSYIPITIFVLVLIFFLKRRNFYGIFVLFLLFLAFVFFSLNIKGFESSLNLRLNFYKAGIEIFYKSPIFGVGYNHVSDYLENYMRMGLIDNAFHTHNIYTDALSETGIIGFMIFLITYFYFAINFLFSGYKENNFLSISAGWIIVMILISGFFEKNLDRATIDLLIFSIMGLARAKKPPIEQ